MLSEFERRAAAQAPHRHREHLHWLLEEGSAMDEPDRLLGDLARRIDRDSGVPLAYAELRLATVHPTVRRVSVSWRRDADHVEVRRGGAGFPADGVAADPPASARRLWLKAGGVSREQKRELNVRGLTDALVVPLRFGGDLGAGTMLWGTDRQLGFERAHVHRLEAASAFLSPVVEAHYLRKLQAGLLDTYLGAAVSAAVRAGQLSRGAARRVPAVLWLSCLRRSSSRASEDDASFATLNAYAAAVTEPVLSRGGEVLKLFGDKLLVLFPTGGDGEVIAVSRALAAAQAALDRLAALNSISCGDGADLNGMIVIHAGEAVVGAIGVDARLDIAAAGKDIDRLFRLAEAGRWMSVPVLLSERVAALAGRRTRVVGFDGLTEEGAPQAMHTLVAEQPTGDS